MTSAWIIERHIGNDLNYWSPGARGRGGLHDWSLDIEFAVRFAREQDATMALYYACDRQGRVAQHRWVDNPAIVTETTRRVSDEEIVRIAISASAWCDNLAAAAKISAVCDDLRDALAREAVLAARVKGLEEALKRCSRRCTNPTAIENIVAAALSPAASDEGR